MKEFIVNGGNDSFKRELGRFMEDERWLKRTFTFRDIRRPLYWG